MTSRAAARTLTGQQAEPSAARGRVFNVPYGPGFLKSLAGAVLHGGLWGRAAPSPEEVPGITVYVPSSTAVEELKLAFLHLAPPGAAFLPRIGVLGGTGPLDTLAAFPDRKNRTAAGLDLLRKAARIPNAYSSVERRLDLTAHVLHVSASLEHEKLAPGERIYVDITPAAAFAAAGTIADLIGEARDDGADLARLADAGSAAQSGTGLLSHRLLHGVLKAWNASKAGTGKIDLEERRDLSMAIEGEAIAASDAPVVIAGSTGSVNATFGLMRAALSRPNGAVVLFGLDRSLDAESFDAISAHPEHPQHGWHQLIHRLGIERDDIADLPGHGRDANTGRVRFLSEALRPGSTTAKWNDFLHCNAATRDTAAPDEEPEHVVFIRKPEVSFPRRRESTRPRSGFDEIWVPAQGGNDSFDSVPAGHVLDLLEAGDSTSVISSTDGERLESDVTPVETQSPAFAGMTGAAAELEVRHGALDGLSSIEADRLQEEAEAVALILRETLEDPKRTAALVSPDEKLLARVRHRMSALGIDTPPPASDRYFLAKGVVRCAASHDASEFIAFLWRASAANPPLQRSLELADLSVLRQMWRPAAIAGLPIAMERGRDAVESGGLRHPALLRVQAVEWSAAVVAMEEAVRAFAPLCNETRPHRTAAGWADSHRSVMSQLHDFLHIEALQPEKPAGLFERLTGSKLASVAMDLAAYAALFGAVAAQDGRVASGSGHPRLILGRPLDTRLLSADVVVLAGLNEGCWPAPPQPGAWLNRREREALGLSPAERRTGQAAQDFEAHAASASRVILTRSRNVNGSLARPSRWVSRIAALAKGAGLEAALHPPEPWLALAKRMRHPEAVTPCLRPAPRPPVSARPRKLSVTALETWFANPYAIYARHILRLEPLRQAGESADARDKGILIHAALQAFFETYGAAFPADTAARLLSALDTAASHAGFDFANAPFWRPRFERFAQWFAGSGAADTAGIRDLKSEAGARYEIAAPAGPFVITARADRIDVMDDGGLRICDFKTSPNTAKALAKRGAQQLALEGMLANMGAFSGVAATDAVGLVYIVAGGGEPPGEFSPIPNPVDKIEAARNGTLAMIAKFDDPQTPYVYGTNPIFADRIAYDPYAHLARVAEWAGPGQPENGSDE